MNSKEGMYYILSFNEKNQYKILNSDCEYELIGVWKRLDNNNIEIYGDTFYGVIQDTLIYDNKKDIINFNKMVFKNIPVEKNTDSLYQCEEVIINLHKNIP